MGVAVAVVVVIIKGTKAAHLALVCPARSVVHLLAQLDWAPLKLQNLPLPSHHICLPQTILHL